MDQEFAIVKRDPGPAIFSWHKGLDVTVGNSVVVIGKSKAIIKKGES